ncbi:hypothetical protein [Streptomyces sp. NPDC001494]
MLDALGDGACGGRRGRGEDRLGDGVDRGVVEDEGRLQGAPGQGAEFGGQGDQLP